MKSTNILYMFKLHVVLGLLLSALLVSCSSDDDNQEEFPLNGTTWYCSFSSSRTDPYKIYGRVCIFKERTFNILRVDYQDKVMDYGMGGEYFYRDGKIYINGKEYDITNQSFTHTGCTYVRDARKPIEFFR